MVVYTALKLAVQELPHQAYGIDVKRAYDRKILHFQCHLLAANATRYSYSHPYYCLQFLHQKIVICVYFLSMFFSKKLPKLNQRGYFFWKPFWKPFTNSFQKCLSFLDFLRYCTMGKARAFRKGLFNRSYRAFFFGKNFLLSTFILVLLKALWNLLPSQYTTIYYFIHHGNKHPITVL